VPAKSGTLSLQPLRTLDLRDGSEPDRPAYLSSASGLVRTGDELCVVADDELHLGRFPLNNAKPGRLQRLFTGDLPDKANKRKKRKPDMEVLLRMPAHKAYPHGALLALGSGSGKHRNRGALLALGATGRVVGRPARVDATAFYARLMREFGDLNLEGGWVFENRLHLLQRGNKGGSPNAVIQLDLPTAWRSLLRERALPDVDMASLRHYDLGEQRSVPLSFTDAAPLPNGAWLFSAVAENTSDSHADGPCVGAAIGHVDAQQRLRWLRAIVPVWKIEGIDAQLVDRALSILLVTDADDPAVPASLLSLQLP
jgi:hypothetical protein